MVEPNQEQLQELKCRELDMLRVFVELCEQLSLRYYLVGGTLLGAVRHQGFIPWDDDIDVGMPREDYEIFVAKGQALLPEYYFLQALATEPHCPYNFAKLRDSRTTFVEYSVRKFPIHHGVFIDIFPLDHYPDSRQAARVMDLKLSVFKYRIRGAVEIPEESRHSPAVEAGLHMVSGLTKLLYPNFQKAMNKREKLLRSVPDSRLWANFCGAWGKKEIMPKQWYGEGAELTFEGLSVRGPREYDKWLTQVYGDYMQLPPVEKRVGHHYTEAIDMDRPYTVYWQPKGWKK